MKTRSTAEIQKDFDTLCAQTGEMVFKILNAVSVANNLQREFQIAKELQDHVTAALAPKEEPKEESKPELEVVK